MAEGDRGDHHPHPADLNRFLLGEMSPRQAAPVLAHLIKGCEHCRMKMEPLASAMFGTGGLPEPPPVADTEYDFPLFKAFAAARRYSEAKAGASQPADLHALGETPVPATSPGSPMERDRALCEKLLDRCRALRHSDPEAVVLAATFATRLAERLESGAADREALADLQARARAELGNARRIADDLAGAESELARALELSEKGTGDPLLLAHLMDLTASLYTDQRRFDDALPLLDVVYSIYRQAGQDHAAGRALISKGVSVGQAYDVHKAVALISQGLELIDARRDPKLAMVGIHTLIWSLMESGQAAQAWQLFGHSRKLFASHVEPLDAIKTVWLEGCIAAALGNDDLAERRFREARSSFEELKLPYDVALVSLDLMALWLRQGRSAEIRSLIEGTIAIFHARRIRREAIGLLLVVREALQQEQVTEALLRTTAAELLRLGDAPGRRSRVED
jgi:tetratricopeptide (TPR) repeat protein